MRCAIIAVSIAIVLISVVIEEHAVNASPPNEERYAIHPDLKSGASGRTAAPAAINPAEIETSYWQTVGQKVVATHASNTPNTGTGKNVILFLGDGMSLHTVAAARNYLGGEHQELAFEKFPHFGLSKTYCVNRQTADSACSATAYLTGVKANYGTIGVDARVRRYSCEDELNADTHTVSIAKWAMDAGKHAGLVTTARVTHASPAGVYAHTANRDWENDAKVAADKCDTQRIVDIARQLVEQEIGQSLRVVLGGGRGEFRDATHTDEESQPGYRADGRNLIDEWKTMQSAKGNASYVHDRRGLMAIDVQRTDYVLGLFEASHCMYNLDVIDDKLEQQEPTLAEMVETAIRVLSKNDNGFFLFVEGGRIDMAHHENWARLALDETAEFAKAVERAQNLTNAAETLIVVTSDHAHVMTFNGYPKRGADILGMAGRSNDDKLPYTTLSYGNGPGYSNTYDENGKRKNMSGYDFTDTSLRYSSTVPLDAETHGGDDVGIYASGPWSHLFVGNYEQNNIPLLMAYAAKIGVFAKSGCTSLIATGVSLSGTMILAVIAVSIVTFTSQSI